MILEDYTPEPIDETVARSRIFFEDALKRSKSDVERAQTRVDDALRNYDDSTFDGGTVIRDAEDNLAKCEAELEVNRARLEWESSRSFARTIKPDRPMIQPWRDAPQEWLVIFQHHRRL